MGAGRRSTHGLSSVQYSSLGALVTREGLSFIQTCYNPSLALSKRLYCKLLSS